MRILILIFAVLFSFCSLSQLKENLADNHFENRAYYDAAPIYGELADKFLSKKKGDKESVKRAAYSYGKIFEFKTSNKYYKSLLKLDIKALNEEEYMEYVNQLRMVKQYQESVTSAQSALQLFPENQYFKLVASRGVKLDKLFADSMLNSVQLMPFNSNLGDFAPFFYQDGLIYTTKSIHKGFLTGTYAWDHANFTNIVYTTKKEGEWKKPKALSDQFFSRKHDGPVAFSSDESKMVITHNYSNKEKKEGIRYLALYLSEKDEEGKWKELKPFPHDVKNSNTGHGCFSPDGKTLYFVSDREGGKGKTDIYYSKFQYDEWQKPINLEIANTEGEEMFPYVSSENVLYFASNGHLGLGGLDIFMLELNTPSVDPINLGAAINSPADDFGFIVDDSRQSGYFSSNRIDFIDKIFSWERKSPKIQLNGFVYAAYKPKEPLSNQRVVLYSNNQSDSIVLETDDKGYFETAIEERKSYALRTEKEFFELDEKVDFSTNNIRNDTIIIKDLNLNPTTIMVRIQVLEKKSRNGIPTSKINFLNERTQIDTTTFSDENGYLELEVDRHQDYWVRASKKGFIDDEVGFKTGNYSDKFVELELELTKIIKGGKFKLENIFYDLNESTLREESRTALDRLTEFLLENNLKIELSAHTDARGSRSYNKDLSQRRAQSCVDYLIEKGVSRYNIVAKGYGETRLVNKCKDGVDCTEEQHQDNRRTEVKILEIK
jgi:outer membrane protein OmpA-like peptidoglycan-associated protein/tetratricopeptide (TPR) repeat protein